MNIKKIGLAPNYLIIYCSLQFPTNCICSMPCSLKIIHFELNNRCIKAKQLWFSLPSVNLPPATSFGLLLPSLCFLPDHLELVIRKLPCGVSHCIPAYQCFEEIRFLIILMIYSLALFLSSVSFFRKEAVPSMLLNHFQALRERHLSCLFVFPMRI